MGEGWTKSTGACHLQVSDMCVCLRVGRGSGDVIVIRDTL